MSHLRFRSTSKPKCRRKSAPKSGFCTSAITKIQRNVRRRPRSIVRYPSVALIMSHPLTAEFEQLRSEVARLQESIQSLMQQSHARPRSHRSSSHSSSPAVAHNSGVCWVPSEICETAQKCKSPCTYSSQSNDQVSH